MSTKDWALVGLPKTPSGHSSSQDYDLSPTCFVAADARRPTEAPDAAAAQAYDELVCYRNMHKGTSASESLFRPDQNPPLNRPCHFCLPPFLGLCSHLLIRRSTMYLVLIVQYDTNSPAPPNVVLSRLRSPQVPHSNSYHSSPTVPPGLVC
jgi:hypothetical protein